MGLIRRESPQGHVELINVGTLCRCMPIEVVANQI